MGGAMVGRPFVIERGGTFDVPAARQVALVLAGAPGLEVRIDLSRVRDFPDLGLAVLARSLAGRRPRARVFGLRQHPVRLLRYLGIETEPEAGPGSEALAD